MKALVDKEECIGCGECINVCPVVCPTEAVKLEKKVASISDACTGCGICVEVCPTGAILLY